MHLHVKSQEVAWSGVLMALAVLLIVMGGVIESSTLFFLAASSFLTGIIYRRFNAVSSIGFACGCFVLGIILAPQKLYCFTFLGFSIYVIVAEYFRKRDIYSGRAMIIKGICYHLLMAVALVMVYFLVGYDSFFDGTVFQKLSNLPGLIVVLLFVFIEALWLIFDRVYLFFQNRYGKLFIR